jgi:hypothetical protein
MIKMFQDKSNREVQKELMQLAHKLKTGNYIDREAYNKASEQLAEQYNVTASEVRSFVAQNKKQSIENQLTFVTPNYQFKQLLEVTDDKSLDLLERQLQQEREKRQREKERKNRPFQGQYLNVYREERTDRSGVVVETFRLRLPKLFGVDNYSSIKIHNQKEALRVAKWANKIIGQLYEAMSKNIKL